MKKIIVRLIFLACFPFVLSVYSQETKGKMRNDFLLENDIMVTNTDGELFPVFNNEFSICYGVNSFFWAGIFYDFYHVSRSYHSFYYKGNKHIVGVKTIFSVLPLLNERWNNKLKHFNLNIDGYFSYKSNPDYFIFEEKKDKQAWVNYYRINVQYFFNSKFFLSASAGIINSNRFLIGGGIKF